MGRRLVVAVVILALGGRTSASEGPAAAAVPEGALAALVVSRPTAPLPLAEAPSLGSPASGLVVSAKLILAPGAPDLLVQPRAAHIVAMLRAPTPDAPAGGGFRGSRALAWTAISGGAALIATGLAARVTARGWNADLRGDWLQRGDTAAYDARSKDARAFSRLGNVLIGAGAVATGFGAFCLVRLGRDRLTVEPDMLHGRTGVVATGHF